MAMSWAKCKGCKLLEVLTAQELGSVPGVWLRCLATSERLEVSKCPEDGPARPPPTA